MEHVQHFSSPLSVSFKHSGFYPEQEQRQPRNFDSLGLIPKHSSLTFPSSLDKVTRNTAHPPPALGPSLLTFGPFQRQAAEGKESSLVPPTPSILYLGPGLIFKPTKCQKVTHQAYLSCHSSPESPSPRPSHPQTNRIPPLTTTLNPNKCLSSEGSTPPCRAPTRASCAPFRSRSIHDWIFWPGRGEEPSP